MKKRLFFALNATDPLKTTFLPTYKKLKINADQRELAMKWVPLDNLHATITFIGPTEEENIPALAAALEKVCANFAPFDLKIEDVSAFSNEHDARVLWLGVQNKRCLNTFKNILEQELIEQKLIAHAEERDYVPHITFARLRNPKSVKDMLSPFKRKSFGKIHVSEIVLYESQVQGNYTVYKPLIRCKLTGEVEKTSEEVFLAP